jgi:hypothetical protein
MTGIHALSQRYLLEMKPVNIRRHMCLWFANRYEESAKAFILQGKPARITTTDVVNLMGLPAKGQEFHPDSSMRTTTLFVDLKDKNTSRISLLQKWNQTDLPLR